MTRLTVSGLARAEACPASTALPQVEQPPSQWSEEGREIHRYVERLALGIPRAAALLSVPEECRARCEAIDLSPIESALSARATVLSEWPLAWDSATGETRPLSGGPRSYSDARPGELCGTPDLAWRAEGDVAVVLDIKTGWGELPPPAESLQLLGYAVQVAALFGVDSAVVGYLLLREGAPARLWTATLDALALDAAEERIVAAMRGAQGPGARDRLRLGPHCKYCPAFLACPAQATLLSAAAGKTPAELVGDDLPAAVERLDALERATDAARRLLRERAMAHPISLPDGTVYGPRTRARQSVDAARARPILGALGLWPQAADESVTLTRVKSAAMAAGLDPEVVVGELRAAGAIETAETVTIDRHKP